MKCDNCRAYNAHVIYVEDERMLLCPRCLTILKELNDEYHNIVQADEGLSYRHIGEKDA